MKQYFAKYLPVEGGIKIGDKFSLDGEILIAEDILYAPKTLNGEIKLLDTQKQLDARKKVKLFLCSRDTGNSIGELSEKVQWVKENQEFDESEIGVITGTEQEPFIIGLDWVKEENIKGDKLTIKCPHCSQFTL